jgi:hypothetical protein
MLGVRFVRPILDVFHGGDFVFLVVCHCFGMSSLNNLDGKTIDET